MQSFNSFYNRLRNLNFYVDELSPSHSGLRIDDPKFAAYALSLYKAGAMGDVEYSTFAESGQQAHKRRVQMGKTNSQMFDGTKVKGLSELSNMIKAICDVYGIKHVTSYEINTQEEIGKMFYCLSNGKIGIYTTPAYYKRLQKNFGYSFPVFLEGMFHELEHSKQNAYTHELLNGNTNIPPYYKFMAALKIMEETLISCDPSFVRFPGATSKQQFRAYYLSPIEMDARATATLNLITLKNNKNLAPSVKNEIIKYMYDDNGLLYSNFNLDYITDKMVFDMEASAARIKNRFLQLYGNDPTACQIASMVNDNSFKIFSDGIVDKFEIVQRECVKVANDYNHLKLDPMRIVMGVKHVVQDAPSVVKNAPRIYEDKKEEVKTKVEKTSQNVKGAAQKVKNKVKGLGINLK